MSTAFNQLLSFDTSSVAVMYGMFDVRTARALPSTFTVGSSMRAARAAKPACHPLLILPSHLAGRGGVQPAAELRHFQCHNHGVHVEGVLRACPTSGLCTWVHPARCLRRPRRPMLSRLPACMAPFFLCFPLHSAEHGVQPAAEL
eukprot:scaffold75318_cov50-Phaeocystis_antarctica.AAC.1